MTTAAIRSPEAFRGVRRLKYEQMLEERREVLESMTLADLDRYLAALERRYRQRAFELAPSYARELGATDQLKATDVGRWIALNEQAQRRAMEAALEEMLAA